MKIGYPCMTRSLEYKSHATFRLSSFTETKFLETVKNNLQSLMKILEYNKSCQFSFFRISSDIIPFASHPVCNIEWQKIFCSTLDAIGKYILKNKIRISMHPSQFVLINAIDEKIVEKSIKDLVWHCQFLDLLNLHDDAKVQIHIGGVYNDKTLALERFIDRYHQLPTVIKKRLVIENDDKLYSFQDCLKIHEKTGIPIIVDNLHHECLNNGEKLSEIISLAAQTWRQSDGILMADYSSQAAGKRIGTHTASINKVHFRKYIEQTRQLDFDIMLEIKDKELSAIKALNIAQKYRTIV